MKYPRLDETDVEVLEELRSNSRISRRKLAKKLGVSPGTVYRRIKKLENNGVIRAYTVVVDHTKAGYPLRVIIEVTMSQGRLFEMEREISKIWNVSSVYDVTGPTDAIIIADFETVEELSLFTKRLLGMDYVERSSTHLILRTMKDHFISLDET